MSAFLVVISTRFSALNHFIIIIKFVTIFTKTLINGIYNMLQDNTRDWNVEQDLRPNQYLTPYDYTVYINLHRHFLGVRTNESLKTMIYT
jgi:hypothetical protein